MDSNLEIEIKWQELKSKCDYYFSRIISYPLCPPEHVYFCLTNRCNLKCKMCNISTIPGEDAGELSTEECEKIIDQIVDLKIDHLVFSGGEPLLREDIFDLVNYAVNKNIKIVGLITNGLLINEEAAKRLINIGANQITISIDGLEETNDFMRGKGSFQKAIQAVGFINKYKNNNLPTLGINFTITNYNIDQILPVIGLIRNRKCDVFLLQPVLSDNTNMQIRKKNELWVSEENMPILKEAISEVSELKKTLRDLSIKVNDEILKMIPAYFLGQPLDRGLKCYECIARITISYNGDLWSCGGIYGNLRKNPLKDCWFSVEAAKIRREVKQCKNHCLQNCVYLSGLSDIYSEARKFKSSINGYDKNKDYSDKLLALFRNYNFLLKKERQTWGFESMLGGNRNNFKDLDYEIAQISAILKDAGESSS